MASTQQRPHFGRKNTSPFPEPFLQMIHAPECTPTPAHTWSQREFLLPHRPVELPGFNWQHYQEALLKPLSAVDRRAQVHRRGLAPHKDMTQHTWGFHTWQDVGQLPAAFPARPNIHYDSNIWRWLTNASAHRQAPTETSVPPPSRLGAHSFLTFIYCNPIFRDTKRKKQVIAKTQTMLQQGQKLQLRSEARVPPLDAKGNILAPKNFKKFPHISAGGRFQAKGPQLLANPLPNLFARRLPCPNPLPHYQQKTFGLVLQPRAPLSQELVSRYVALTEDRLVWPLCHSVGPHCSPAGRAENLLRAWMLSFSAGSPRPRSHPDAGRR
ncbi:testis-expressed protein 52 [Sorex fumeus]|uniref:testis-expressed protein 52 n=1 Tax=Sorex fumeus TaxID=62283 RepID=UPI0024AD9DFF|nr:testis-expressed protein 52 [Sorex fumeus]